MSKEVTADSEPLQRSGKYSPVWLAGFLEVRGSLQMVKSNGSLIPTIAFKGEGYELQTIYNLFETLPTRRDIGSSSAPLRFQRDKALSLLNEAAPYSPYVSGFLYLIDQRESLSSQDWDKIYKEWKEEKYTTVVPLEDDLAIYRKLVTNRDFLAGIFDGRGRAHESAPGKPSSPQLIIETHNIALLTALHECYGGHLEISGRGNYVRFVHNQARNLLGEIKDSMLLRGEKMVGILSSRGKEISTLDMSRQEFAQHHAAWLSGFFELSEEFGFSSTNSRGQKVLVPRIRVRDTAKIDELRRFFHLFSSVYHRNVSNTPNKNSLIIAGKKVKYILQAAADYTGKKSPKERFFLEDWGDSSNVERLNGYREMLQSAVGEGSIEQDYTKLVEDIRYVAGLVDRRGKFRFRTNKAKEDISKKFYPHFSLTTSKISLLYALRDKYGGNIYENTPNSYTWSLESVQLGNFYTEVKDHLQLRSTKEQAEAVVDVFSPKQIKKRILHLLAENLISRSPLSIWKSMSVFYDTNAPLPLNSVKMYMKELEDDGRILAGKDDSYSIKLSPENMAIVEASPIAIQELFLRGLYEGMVITPTGKILKIGNIWYDENLGNTERKVIDKKIRILRGEKGNVFSQFSFRGMTIDYFPAGEFKNVTSYDYLLDVLRESLQGSLSLAYERLDELMNPDIITYMDPNEVAESLLKMSRTRR